MFNSEETNIAVIKVIGVGGGGNNAINSMIDSNLASAEFISVNTDKQVLLLSKADKRIQIGASLTKGLGAGANPEIGERAAEENKDELTELIKGTDLLFIAAELARRLSLPESPRKWAFLRWQSLLNRFLSKEERERKTPKTVLSTSENMSTHW